MSRKGTRGKQLKNDVKSYIGSALYLEIWSGAKPDRQKKSKTRF